MTAVGLTDVFEYGGKFLGYLSVVAIAGGGVFGAGAYLASTGGVALGDPSVSSLTTYRAMAGAGIAAVGGLITFAGLVGLAHKFVADVIAVGVANGAAASGTPRAEVGVADADDESAEDESADSGEAVATDESDADDETPDEGAGQDTDDQAAATPSEAEAPETPPGQPEVETSRTEAPSAGANDAASQVEGPEADTATEPAQDPEPPARQPNSQAGAADAGPAVADEATSGPVEESTPPADDVDWAESEYATEAADPAEGNTSQTADADAGSDERPGADDGFDHADGHADDAADTRESTGTEDVTQEWTPPDPSEFEQPAPADDVPEASSDDGLDDDGSGEPESGRRWEDVQGSGSPAETGTAAGGDPDPIGGDDAVDRGTGGDALDERGAYDESAVDTREPDAEADPAAFADEGPPGHDAPSDDGDDSVSFADEVTEEPDEDDELGEDVTLADEGVTSFEAKGDDDPLADRLPGDDS